MNKVEISKLNLRDLAILDGLVSERRIGPVADRLGISPSAVSYALDRLRHALQDELVLRESHGFRPTEKGQVYAREARGFLARLTQLQRDEAFDPLRDSRRLTLTCTEYELDIFLADVLSGALAEAPGLSIRLLTTSNQIDPKRLFDDIDLAFVPLRLDMAGVSSEALFTDRYLTFYDPAHQSAPVDLEHFTAAPHAMIDASGDDRGHIDSVLAAHGHNRRIGLVAPSFPALARSMKGTRMFTTLPGRLHSGIMAGFACAMPPLPISAMDIFMVHARSKSTDPALGWFRGKVRSAIARLAAPPAGTDQAEDI